MSSVRPVTVNPFSFSMLQVSCSTVELFGEKAPVMPAHGQQHIQSSSCHLHCGMLHKHFWNSKISFLLSFQRRFRQIHTDSCSPHHYCCIHSLNLWIQQHFSLCHLQTNTFLPPSAYLEHHVSILGSVQDWPVLAELPASPEHREHRIPWRFDSRWSMVMKTWRLDSLVCRDLSIGGLFNPLIHSLVDWLIGWWNWCWWMDSPWIRQANDIVSFS